MDGLGLPPKLLSTLSNAAGTARGHTFIHIYSHFDTDGITSAAIVAKALYRMGTEFSVTIFPVLNAEQFEIIKNNDDECSIVTDLGASYIEEFDALDRDVIVLDHHTLKFTEPKKVVYANPLLYGIDGGSSGCGASMSFLFALALDRANWDLVTLAVTGMVGDRQHLRGMSGLNALIVDKAKEKKLITELPGSLIPYGDLSSRLFTCTDPYINGVTNNPDGVMKLLQEAGIANGKSYSQLTDEENQKLASIIAVRLIKQGVTEDKLNEACRPRFLLPSLDNMNAEELSFYLNAGGRGDAPAMAIGAAMGDKECFKFCKDLALSEQSTLLKGIETAAANLHKLDNIQWFDATESGSTGEICGIIMSSIGDPNKATVGFNATDPQARISSRATFPLLDAGVDMAAAMSQACKELGGEGGGHRIAAGGSIPREKIELLFPMVDKIVAEQKKNKMA